MPKTHKLGRLEPLERVRRAKVDRLASELAFHMAVEDARAAGHTFAEIGEAAGMTRAGVHNYLSRRGQT